jgi:hypothetical protein
VQDYQEKVISTRESEEASYEHVLICLHSMLYNTPKHTEICHHFITDALQCNNTFLKHKPTETMTADILTTGIDGPKYKKCIMWFRFGVTE